MNDEGSDDWTCDRSAALAAAALLFEAVPVMAHHSSAPFYDSTKKVEAQGPVTKFLFKNPHSFLYFDATTTRARRSSGRSSSARRRRSTRTGWTPETLKPGTIIKVVGQPSRAEGTHGMCCARITRPDGSPIVPGGRVEEEQRRRGSHRAADPRAEPTSWPTSPPGSRGPRSRPGRESPRSIWAYPTILTLHTVGLGIVVGMSAVVDLTAARLRPPYSADASLRPLFRMIAWAFALNAATGVVLFMSDATTKVHSRCLYIKLTLIALALWNTFARTGAWCRERRARRRQQQLARPDVAVTSLVLWAAAITAGRLMAYL